MVKLGPPRPIKAVVKIVTAERALDTTYRNTTGRPLLCHVGVRHVRGNVAGALAHVEMLVDDVTPPVKVISLEGLYPMDNVPEDYCGSFAFAVPDGYYYQVYSIIFGAGSANTLGYWTEVEL